MMTLAKSYCLINHFHFQKLMAHIQLGAACLRALLADQIIILRKALLPKEQCLMDR